MTSIFFLCKNCGVKIEADDSYSGGVVICPKCNIHIEVPMAGLGKGFEIGGFVLEKRLGAGGMGEVWLADQLSMERKVALKILSPSLCKDKDFVGRFIKEVKTSAKLVHPNIVTAFDAGFDKGFHFLAVQYVNGRDLEATLISKKTVREREALRILRGIAEGLQYAWNKHKLLHRDIKPSNIIIDVEDMPKLMDMGISKSLMDDISMTLTGVIVGTPCYMSPEQARADKEIDFRSDIYSLGATLYHLVTGKIPFEGESAMSVITKLLTEPLPPPKIKNPSVSKQCSALIEAMMEKNPADRQQSWEDVVRDFDLVLEGRMPLGGKKELPLLHRLGDSFERNRKMILAAGTAALVIIVLLACVAILKKAKNKREKQEEKIAKVDNVRRIPQETTRHETEKHIARENPSPAPLPVHAPVQTATDPVVVQPSPQAPPASSVTPVTPATTQISTPDQLREALQKLNPGVPLDKCRIAIKDGKWEIDFKAQGVKDISPLAGLPISGLSLYGTNITDIGALKGAPIKYLNLSGLKLNDYSVLKGMPIDVLTLMGSSMKDLSVINKDTIRNLLITYSPVEDISPLKGAQISKLWLSYTKVSDLGPLKGMPLRELLIDGIPAKDLSPIMGMELETLVLTPSNFTPDQLRSLHDGMKSLKYIGTSHGEVGMNKQTAEEFWRKLVDGKIKGPTPPGDSRPPPHR